MPLNYLRFGSSFFSGILVSLVGLFCETSVEAQAPNAPTGLTVTQSFYSTDNYGYTLKWTDNSTNETHFNVSVSTNGGASFQDPFSILAPNTTSVTYSIPSSFPNLVWAVRAYNGTSFSPASNLVSTSVPGSFTHNPPSGLVGSFPVTDTLRLSWADNSNQEAYQEIWARDIALGGAFQIIAYADFNVTTTDLYYYLQRGKSYEIKLQAVRFNGTYNTNPLGSGFSSPITVTVPGTEITSPPSAPTNLTLAAHIDASAGNARSYGVYWDDPSPDNTGFEIQQKQTTSATWWSLGVLGAQMGVGNGVGLDWRAGINTSGSQIALASGDSYDFRIRSARGSGPFAVYSTTYTSPATSVQADFNAPTDLRASAPADNGRIQLFWSDNAISEVGYEFEYRIGTTGSFTPLPGGAIALTAFSRYQFDGGIGFFPPSSTVFFRIRASRTTSPTTTAYSNEASITTPPLTPPTNFTATALGEQSVKFDWTDNSGNEQGYIVQARFHVNGSPSGSFFDIGTTAVNAQTLTVTAPNLPYPGLAYEFRILAAFDPGGSNPLILSNPSNAVSLTLAFNAPTAVTATVVNDASVNLTWQDNSAVETKYSVLVRLVGSTQWDLLADKPAGATSHSSSVLFPGTAYEFAVIGVFTRATNDEVETPLSNVATATTSPFSPPTGLTVTALSEQSVRFNWTDNSSAEGGYIAQARFFVNGSPSGNFFDIGSTAVNAQTLTVNAPDLPYPGISYEFRVLAAYDPDGAGSAPLILSNPSNAVSTTLAFNAPSAVSATVVNESSINLAWTDNSSVETKYTVLARRVGTTSWGVLADKPAGATSHSATSLLPGTAFEFAVIGVFTRAANDEVETPLSNIATATTPLNAPTGLQLQSGSLTDTQAVLTWTDPSAIEGGFEILSRPGGSSSAPTTFAFVAANSTSATIPLTPGTSREFFVRSFYVRTNTEGDVAVSSNSNGVTVNAKDAMTSAIYVEVVKDVLMTPYTLTHTSQSALQSRSITGLPAGLSFNSTSGQVTGTPTGSGVVQSTVTLTFADGWTQTKILAFRILLAPVVASFPNQSIALGSPSVISLTGKFTDPDASSAARVNTNLTANGGNMDFILFDTATPLHVANFMGYATRGDYVNTVFHRSIAGFISQGGAFRAGSGATTFTAAPTVASPTNEPGISNVRGTVALAKLGGQPSSGTNQFFVNLANNGPNSAANLDAQNGGFTAFARVTAPGMAVADALAALPTGDYNVTVDSTANTFEDFPVNAASAPATMNNALAVKINSVTALPVLSYSLVSNSLPSIATASVNGTSLTLTPVAAGTTTVVVRATDLEGLIIDHSITVTVNGTFASWATSESLPNGQNGALDDADTDGTSNLEEWAFLSSPSSGSDLGKPTPSVSPTGDPTGRIHFKARKFAAGLSFIVQASETLNGGDWVDIWNSETDGYSSPRVTVNEDNADHRVLTVTDVETIVTGAERRFLRVKLVQAP